MPLPDSVHQTRGNRSNRKLKVPPPPSTENPTLVKRPREMEPEVAVWWESIIDQCRKMGNLRESDSLIVAQLADLLERYHRLGKETRGAEVLVDDETNKITPNPKFAAWKGLARDIRQLFDKIGLTPASRTRLMAGVRDPSNPPGDSLQRPKSSVSKYVT